jgi:transposase
MSMGYSLDLRTRLVECVEAGASRHEAAKRFEVSVSSAVRWMQRFVRFGSAAAKPSDGSTSPLEAHAAWLLVIPRIVGSRWRVPDRYAERRERGREIITGEFRSA